MRVTITKLDRDVRGFWTARVTIDGDTVSVDNRIGPWTMPVDPNADPGSNRIVRREILPDIATRLRSRARAAERGESQDESDMTITPSPMPPRRRDASPAPQRDERSAAERIAGQMAAAASDAVKKAA
jgi:hypothetical protein